MSADEPQEDQPRDPAHWAGPEHRIKAPDLPPVSKLSCTHAQCSGTAYGDGSGGFICTSCSRPAA